MGRISPNYFVQDSVIPRTRLAEVLGRSTTWPPSTSCAWPTSSTPATATCTRSCSTTATKEGEPERAEELAGLIVKACVEAGGSITGEHGVGVDKKRYMPDQFEEPDLAAFQRLRCAFDPGGLANPGKVMPTPRLCGEVPGPYRRHPLGGGGAGGADVSSWRRWPQPASPARRCASWARAASCTGACPSSDEVRAHLDRGPRPPARAQRGRPDRDRRGRAAAVRGPGRVRRARPGAAARSARPRAAPPPSAGSSPPATRARCAPATAARATWFSACRWRCRTARRRARAAR